MKKLNLKIQADISRVGYGLIKDLEQRIWRETYYRQATATETVSFLKDIQRDIEELLDAANALDDCDEE